jgi:hypothetical protein
MCSRVVRYPPHGFVGYVSAADMPSPFPAVAWAEFTEVSTTEAVKEEADPDVLFIRLVLRIVDGVLVSDLWMPDRSIAVPAGTILMEQNYHQPINPRVSNLSTLTDRLVERTQAIFPEVSMTGLHGS